LAAIVGNGGWCTDLDEIIENQPHRKRGDDPQGHPAATPQKSCAFNGIKIVDNSNRFRVHPRFSRFDKPASLA
jgi:hypothetical protein